MGQVTGSNIKIYFWLVFFTKKIRVGLERKVCWSPSTFVDLLARKNKNFCIEYETTYRIYFDLR